MAWWAYYKWDRRLCKKDYLAVIQGYQRLLYEQWWDGLPEEEKAIYRAKEEDRRRAEERAKASLDRGFAVLGNIFSHMYERSGREDSYGAQDAIRTMRNMVREL